MPKILSDSLISKIESPRLCLPGEYREVIFNNIANLSDKKILNFCGKLRFCYGGSV